MTIRNFNGISPKIDKTAYIDASAVVIGRVSIGKNSSIWCNAVARGDVSDIIIGENTNIQENINTNNASNYETLDESVWETLVYLY